MYRMPHKKQCSFRNCCVVETSKLVKGLRIYGALQRVRTLYCKFHRVLIAKVIDKIV